MKKRVEAFIELGLRIQSFLDEFESSNTYSEVMKDKLELAFAKNGWFSEDNILKAFNGISHMTQSSKMQKWLASYPIKESIQSGKKIGVIMAGNLPVVGFHDLLCILCSGHRAMIKMSSDDEVLLPFITDLLIEINPELSGSIEYVDRLEKYDAVIATGSNNSARYFEYYFKNKPHIIRKNRNSIAVLDGSETEEELKDLGKDIFSYYGLGCRNVSKILMPNDFDLDRIFGAIVDFGEVINNNKYFNNYHYYKTIYMMKKDDLLENGFLLMKEDDSTYSPVSMLFYQRYQSDDEVLDYLESEKQNIQCVVSKHQKLSDRVAFGKSQSPELWDYSDGVDTMQFLLGL